MAADDIFSVAGRVALITGAARGIGRALAAGFAARGARVVLADIDGDGIEGLAREIRDAGGSALPVAGDVSKADDVARVVDGALSVFGCVDILINNAGICTAQHFLELAEDDWDRTMAVNTKSAFLFTQAVLPCMQEREWGRILMVSSLAGRSGGVHVSAAYSASKAALMGLAKGIAREVAPDNITVNILAPGATDTALYADWPEEKKQTIRERIPAGRFAMPGDIVGAAVFLASEAASYITGATIDINGGLLIV